jgi:hypothetical protein
LPVGLGGHHLLEHVLRVAEDRRREATDLVGWRALPARRRRRRLLLVGAATTAAHHLSPADQDARVDAERPADDPEHHHGADAEAAADRQSEPTAAALAAPVLDIGGGAEIFPAHRSVLRNPARPGP